MYIVPKYIENLISQGENQQLDLKFEISDSQKIAKSIVAFANTNGGTLLVGVKDNGVIAGVRSDEEFYMVQVAANLYSKPKIPFEVKRWDIGKKTILEIFIPKSKNMPHYAVNEENIWKSYIRFDDQNLLVNNIQLQVWKRQNLNKPVKIHYSRKEELLLSCLEEDKKITFNDFYNLTDISKKAAENIIIDFILLDIIEIIYSETKMYFKLK